MFIGRTDKSSVLWLVSYAAAPVPFPVGTDLVDKHMHFMSALILLMG